MYLDSSGKTFSGSILSSAPLSILYASNRLSHFFLGFFWSFMCRFSVTYRVDFGYFLHANDFCDHRLQIVRIVGIEKRVLLMDTTTSSQIWPLKWWWWPLGMTSAAHDKYYTGPYAPQCIYIDCIYNPQAGGEGVERGLTRGDGKHGTCGPPERRPVERERSRPGELPKRGCLVFIMQIIPYHIDWFNF